MKSNIYFSQLEGHLVGLPEDKKTKLFKIIESMQKRMS